MAKGAGNCDSGLGIDPPLGDGGGGRGQEGRDFGQNSGKRVDQGTTETPKSLRRTKETGPSTQNRDDALGSHSVLNEEESLESSESSNSKANSTEDEIITYIMNAAIDNIVIDEEQPIAKPKGLETTTCSHQEDTAPNITSQTQELGDVELGEETLESSNANSTEDGLMALLVNVTKDSTAIYAEMPIATTKDPERLTSSHSGDTASNTAQTEELYEIEPWEETLESSETANTNANLTKYGITTFLVNATEDSAAIYEELPIAMTKGPETLTSLIVEERGSNITSHAEEVTKVVFDAAPTTKLMDLKEAATNGGSGSSFDPIAEAESLQSHEGRTDNNATTVTGSLVPVCFWSGPFHQLVVFGFSVGQLN